MIDKPFTQSELGLFGLALMKCHMLQELLGKKGKYKLCVVTKENLPKATQQGHILMVLPFGFPETSDVDLSDILERLEEQEKLAWLREQKK
jgi:hypothetical protein